MITFIFLAFCAFLIWIIFKLLKAAGGCLGTGCLITLLIIVIIFVILWFVLGLFSMAAGFLAALIGC